jgi:HSP20 family protein
MAKEKEVPVKKEESTPARFDQQMEHLFEDFFNRRWLRPFSSDWPAWSTKLETKTPKVDVVDRETEVFVKAELPGFNKDEIEVNVTGNSITVKGSARKEEEKDADNYHQREIVSSFVSRTVPLPCEVDGDNAKAKLKDGMLEVTIPKAKGAQTKRIEIES